MLSCSVFEIWLCNCMLYIIKTQKITQKIYSHQRAISSGRLVIPSPKNSINLSTTYKKLHCKGEPYRFGGYVILWYTKTDAHVDILLLLFYENFGIIMLSKICSQLIFFAGRPFVYYFLNFVLFLSFGMYENWNPYFLFISFCGI